MSKFRFKSLDRIGAADAEEDEEFLKHCFVDGGYLAIIRDCDDPRRIVLGRTGAGKTALLHQLQECEKDCIEIRAESLALSYISNSTILSFIATLGVNLDTFFKLLWRHVITVELLKHHFHINNEKAKRTFLDSIRDAFCRQTKHAAALKYLEDWGQSFWQDTEYRIKETTQKIEAQLEANIDFSKLGLPLGARNSFSLSEEQKRDVIQRAQSVVNNVQIRQLSDVLDLVADVLRDQFRRYYLTVDHLDKSWVDDKIRFRMIRALIETAKDFKKVSNAKVVIALRQDLLEKVVHTTRDSGFQEEKYASLYLPIVWERGQLIELLDSRIKHLIRRKYTSGPVTHADVFPDTIRREKGIDYFLKRTLCRPRDVILFFNKCIECAGNDALITADVIKRAEGEYSRSRLSALGDEWVLDYPDLVTFAEVLKERPQSFAIGEIDDDTIADLCLDYASVKRECEGELGRMAREVILEDMDIGTMRKALFKVFHRVGIVGLKTESYEKVSWSQAGAISFTEIADTTRVHIHPSFYRVLGIREC